MSSQFFHKIRPIILKALLMLAFFAGGIYVGYYNRPEIDKVVNIENKTDLILSEKTDFTPFWKTWNNINEKYPGGDQIDNQKKIYGAISGLVQSLDDPYSVFFDPEQTKEFEEEISGNFSGVGMEVGMRDKLLTVIAPLKNSPAQIAGIKSGDRILKIDETVTNGLSVDEAIKLIRGEAGTTVTLSISRDGEKEPKEIKIIRDIINIPTIETTLRPDGVFVITLYSFSANSAKDFTAAIKEFAKSKSDKLILDLRGNPGGYLNAAVNMASWFLEEGKTVVTEDYGEKEEPKVFRSKGYNLFKDNLKFAILIDGGSASASEILAGAMQDYKKAILVGEKSYGKGSVQEIVKITPETILKITVAKWLTPNGNSISEKGLTPDYTVIPTAKDLEAKKDVQMEKAVELLLKNN